jgi:hypothetical protein
MLGAEDIFFFSARVPAPRKLRPGMIWRSPSHNNDTKATTLAFRKLKTLQIFPHGFSIGFRSFGFLNF